MYDGSRRSSLGASSSSLSNSPEIREGAGEAAGARFAPDVGLTGVVGSAPSAGFCGGCGDFALVLRSAAACCRWTMYLDALFGSPFSPTSGL